MQQATGVSLGCASIVCIGTLALKLHEARLKRKCFREGLEAAVLIARLLHAAVKLLAQDTSEAVDDVLAAPLVSVLKSPPPKNDRSFGRVY